MIKTLVAYTKEIDDIQLAVKEIQTQLDAENVLLKNTIGIISCHYEFVFSGVTKALADALPFEITGTITSVQAINDVAGDLLLTLMVLTSDEAEFAVGLTPDLHENPGEKIKQTYLETSAPYKEKPALTFAFAPFMVENSGDEYINVFTEVSGGVPCFGTLAVDDTNDFSCCFLVHKGESYGSRLAMVLIYGDISPKFFIATISKSKILDKPALVTKSAGHVLMELNNQPVVNYFENLGLTKASETQYAMTSLPFMLDYGDGTPPVSKVFVKLSPEKYAICAGSMPEGSNLYLGVFDKDDVILTTKDALAKALADLEGKSGILIYSCISRSMTLGVDHLAELELVQGAIGNQFPFMMSYSGGEMCPTQITDNKAINRFHNNAFIGCLF